MSWYSKLFAPDEEEEAERGVADRTRALEVLACADMPYFKRLMAHLDSVIDEPTKIHEHAFVRVNTFKEFRAKIRRDIRDAQAVLGEIRRAD